METAQTGTHMSEDAMRESMVSRFSKITGVGQTKAHILYDAGFTSIESLRRASEKDFAEINGISPAFARHLKREVVKLPKDMEKDVPKAAGLTIKADGVEVRPKKEEAAKDTVPQPSHPAAAPKPAEAKQGRGTQAGEEDEGSSGIFKKWMRGFTGKAEPAPSADKAKQQEKTPVSVKAVKEEPKPEPKKEGEAAKDKPKEGLGPNE